MWLTSWLKGPKFSSLRRQFTRRVAPAAKRRWASTTRLDVELLEDRRVMSFLPPVYYPLQDYTQAIVTADLNGDGKLDLATVNDSAYAANVLLGNGDGTFQTPLQFATEQAPQHIAVGDVNGDGKPDLVTANSLANSLSVLLGNGDGTFQPALNLPIGATPNSVAIGDLNGDGKPDLAVTASVQIGTYYECQEVCDCWAYDENGNCTFCNCYESCTGYPIYQGSVDVLLGNGDGTFAAPSATIVQASFPQTVAVVDFNGDGKLDAAIAGEVNSATVLLGDGAGGFTSITDYPTDYEPTDLVVTDFNHDGKPDLATSNFSTSDLSVLIGNGDGSFQNPINLPNIDWVDHLTAADFDHDGNLDLLATNDYGLVTDNYGLSVFLGNGDGTFQTVQRTSIYSIWPGSIAAGDFNGDGFPDAALGTFGTVGVLINTGIWKTLQVSDASIVEGDSGTVNAVFTVTLSAPNSNTVAVNYATADGTATAGADYVATSGMLTFAPGQTTRTITVPVKGDVLDEDDETFFVNLSSPVNALVFPGDDQGVGSIVDNDAMPAVSINDISIVEGDSGQQPLYFTVNLSAASGRPVTVDFASGYGTAWEGADYIGASGTLTFAPGETTKTIQTPVVGDLVQESDETFLMNLSNPTNATMANYQGIATIFDNDPPPSISVSDATVVEGNSGYSDVSFTVYLSAYSSYFICVSYATANSTATAGVDYWANSGTVFFCPGETGKTVTISVIGDRLVEPNETFFVNLSGPSYGSIADGQGVGTIYDDEPRISISDVAKKEGKKGQTTLFTFTVTLSNAYDQPVTMSFRTVDGTATTGDNDYVAKSGTLTFAPGETLKFITIEVKGDSKAESNETFFLDLFGNSGNSVFTKSRGVGTILNDD